MVRPDPLEGREAPRDLRYILSAIAGLATLIVGLVIIWNVANGGTFAGNEGRDLSFAERLATGIFISAVGAALLRHAVNGMNRLDRSE